MGRIKGKTMKAITRNGSTIDLRRGPTDWLKVIKSTDPSVQTYKLIWLLGTGERCDQPLSWTGGVFGSGWDVVQVVQFRSERLAYKKRGRFVLIGDRTIKRPTMKRCKFRADAMSLHIGSDAWADYVYNARPDVKVIAVLDGWVGTIQSTGLDVLNRFRHDIYRPLADWSKYP